MGDPRARFEDLLDFPTLFVFRVVGVADADFKGRCIALIQETLGRRVEAAETRPSSRGRYCSVRLCVTALSADELREVYQAFRGLEGVRLVL